MAILSEDGRSRRAWRKTKGLAGSIEKKQLWKYTPCQGHPGQQAESACQGTGRDGLIQRVEVRFQRSFKYTPTSKRRRGACEA